MFHGDRLRLTKRPDGFAELCFDRIDRENNQFDLRTIAELRAAVDLLGQLPDLRGVLVTSAKDAFIGANAGEFESRWRAPEDELARSLWSDNEVFMAFEDLAAPTVVAIAGHALGGGCEMALTATYRVMASDARIGLPEVGLGLFPGSGGTVRLPRIASPGVAVEWIVGGAAHGADEALACGVVDAVCPRSALGTLALRWLHDAAGGRLDWRTRQAAKRAPVPLPSSALRAVFTSAHARCDRLAATTPHQPAARMAVTLMAATTRMSRDAAQWQECLAFSKVVRTRAGPAPVQTLVDDADVAVRVVQATHRALDTLARTEAGDRTILRAAS